jgi:hypothetical protein
MACRHGSCGAPWQRDCSSGGADEEQIGIVLGISEKQGVRKLLPPRPGIAELMTDLYTAQ